jgi:hypothetical protein
MMRKNKIALLLGVFLMSGSVWAGIDDGLIAYWNFDNCTAKDNSDNALDGTIIGKPTCVNGVTLNGVTNKALEFDGRSAIERLYADIPASNYTISVWVKATDEKSGIFAVVAGSINNSTGNDRHIYLNSAGKFCQRIWSMDSKDLSHDGSVQYISCTTQPINKGFNLITLVVTDTSTSHYINGVLVKKINSRPSEFYWRDRFFLGLSFDAPHDYFKGVLDEFRYYNRVLSDSEIKSLFDQQSINITGVMRGLKTSGFGVECQNLTTGQNVTVNSASFNFDCQKSGLVVSPNDIIHINVDGVAK